MLIALGSIKGSPGVTTLAVALAAQWPGGATRRLLVECDPAGGDLAMRFDLPLSPGLVSLAVAHRDTPPTALAQAPTKPAELSSNGATSQRSGRGGEVWEHVQSLPGGLPVLLAPPGYDRARAALTALTDPVGGGVLVATGRSDRELLIADCGRLDPGSAAWPIAAAADRLLVLARPRADELAHLASRLDVVAGQAGRGQRGSAGVDIVLVGDGYPPGEVAAELGAPVLATVPDDPTGAAALGGQPALRRASRRGIAHAAAQIAALLAPASATAPGTANGPVTAATARVEMARP